jgi:hypothetical protein
MTGAPISSLSSAEQRELLRDLNYLNSAEIKTFCKRLSIPYRIVVETGDGARRRTNEDDRKGVILGRIRQFLKTGEVPDETCFRQSVVCFDALPEKVSAHEKLFYGQYDKANRAMIALLKDLTGGKFRNGAVARILARDFWTRGKAPTFREYARAWIRATKEHTQPNPEWAFLSDRHHKRAHRDWKKLRAKKASKVIRALNEIIGNHQRVSKQTRFDHRRGARS